MVLGTKISLISTMSGTMSTGDHQMKSNMINSCKQRYGAKFQMVNKSSEDPEEQKQHKENVHKDLKYRCEWTQNEQKHIYF